MNAPPSELIKPLNRIIDWAKGTRDTIGVPLLVIIALSFVAIIALYFSEAVSFLWTVVVLLFAVLNFEILREVKSIHDSRLAGSLEAARAKFAARSAARLEGQEHTFKASFVPNITALAELLGTDFDDSLSSVQALTERNPKNVRCLWRIIEAAVVVAFIACLGVGVAFLGLSAWTSAARTGAIRTPYPRIAIPLKPAGRGEDLPGGELAPTAIVEQSAASSDVAEALASDAPRQMFSLFDWVRAGAQPKGTEDSVRFVSLESHPFDMHYVQFRARVCLQNKSASIESGVAYLFRDIKDLRTYRQIPFGVSHQDEGLNVLELAPDKGESLLLLLRVAETKEEGKTAFGKDPQAYGITLVVGASCP